MRRRCSIVAVNGGVYLYRREVSYRWYACHNDKDYMGYSHLSSPSRRLITKYTGQRYVHKRGVRWRLVLTAIERNKGGGRRGR